MDITHTPAAQPLSVDLTVEQVALACHHDQTLVARLITHADRQSARWIEHERHCQSLAQFDAAQIASEQAQTWSLLGAKFVAVQRFLQAGQVQLAS
ncbi:hypothetical protein GOEFS_008_00040 [Gordonia effusa NBRC 100432]|uniref:TY-Chap C-terminal domain-containing protein n=1 Tax=Gordonia effusa NBRC 100432 TaxID=1077974 RepID=H0QUU4_9ACTN|nr:hypothetical protein [Gordonia effusa]GAB16595.1 hypothetical protein GOEFS_008_00040 [Gordonia effusa NBRC 100432]